MLRRVRLRSTCAYVHGATAMLMLVVMSAGSLGIPVIPVVHKDRSVPFPCQDRACACRDARACWGSCCCMSDQEKLAWAREHGLEPPQDAKISLAARRPAAACGSCCTSKPNKTEVCHESASKTCAVAPEAAASCDDDQAPHMVLLTAQNHCQGYSSWLLLWSSALIEPPPADWALDTTPPALLVTRNDRASVLFERPPTPPPRSG